MPRSASARSSRPVATVLDLACGDANMAEPFLARGFRYRGVDGSAAMIEEARRRLGDRVPLEVARIDEYEPAEPVDLTLCLRAFYYPEDRQAFFRRIAEYTRTKFVFDFRPGTTPPGRSGAIRAGGGFTSIELRPFFSSAARRFPRRHCRSSRRSSSGQCFARRSRGSTGGLFCVAQL